MNLASPRLDSRRFQDIVDEAKGLIPQYCRDWTDHNVSDPGVALLEVFAWMTEMLLFRLNHVPDELYVKFLELVGVRLHPGSAAQADVSFWTSAPQPEPVTIPPGTQAGTVRTEYEEAVVFLTDSELVLVQPDLVTSLTGTAAGAYTDCWNDLQLEAQSVTCFDGPVPGDAWYIGFGESLKSNIIRLDILARAQGLGIDPDLAPLAWEVWSGQSWTACEVVDDDTGGINRDGSVTLMVPKRHEALALLVQPAYWLRCRYRDPTGEERAYHASPTVLGLKVVGLGGTVTCHHGHLSPTERLGTSNGAPGQKFAVRNLPVLPRRKGETVLVRTREGDEEWTEVADFSQSDRTDRHFTWDGATGTVAFGPLIRHTEQGFGRNGQHGLIQHGAIPRADAQIWVTKYQYGGGAVGNVGAGTISIAKTSIPFIARVDNRYPALGGVDPETLDNAKLRGPMALRTGERAVTIRDFERQTLDASPRVARARCLPPETLGGAIRVLVVPKVTGLPEMLALNDLDLPPDLLDAITDHLDERRVLTSSVQVRPPAYQGVTVAATLRMAPGSVPEFVRDSALQALYEFIHPVTGGPDRTGWPFGSDLEVGSLFTVLSGVEAVVAVEEVLLFLANLRTGERGEARQRVRLRDDGLFASYQHQVRVR